MTHLRNVTFQSCIQRMSHYLQAAQIEYFCHAEIVGKGREIFLVK